MVNGADISMALCPACGTKGKTVKPITLESLVSSDVLESLSTTEEFRFCPTRVCGVVYFQPNTGRTISKEALTVRVGQKENAAPRPVCYCFGHTVEEIESDVARTGNTVVLDEIRDKCRQGLDRCEQTNPQGSCCLANVQGVLKKAQAQSGQSTSDDSATPPECCAVSARHADAPGSPERGGLSLSAGAAASGILASACCWLPLLLLAFGVSAGGVAGFFETVRPFFLVVAVLLLGVSFYVAYFHAPACQPGDACVIPNPTLQRFNRVMLWIATVFVIVFALFPYYSPALIRTFAVPPADTTGTGNITGKSMTRVYHIEGMTCAACATGLEARLARIPGVIQARVLYDDKAATIRSLPDQPRDEAIMRAVQNAGFDLINAATVEEAPHSGRD